MPIPGAFHFEQFGGETPKRGLVKLNLIVHVREIGRKRFSNWAHLVRMRETRLPGPFTLVSGPRFPFQ